MRLLLLRHGETQWNHEGRIQGQGLLGLNATGRRQVRKLARAVEREQPVALYTSPLLRARETAGIVGSRLGLSPIELPGLAEADVGDLDGLTGEETRIQFPGFLETWRANPGSVTMPGGESMTQVQERAWRAVEWLHERHPKDAVAAVSHNFTIQALLCRLLGLPLDDFRRLRVELASMTILELGRDGGSLVTLNDRCHLHPRRP